MLLHVFSTIFGMTIVLLLCMDQITFEKGSHGNSTARNALRRSKLLNGVSSILLLKIKRNRVILTNEKFSQSFRSTQQPNDNITRFEKLDTTVTIRKWPRTIPLKLLLLNSFKYPRWITCAHASQAQFSGKSLPMSIVPYKSTWIFRTNQRPFGPHTIRIWQQNFA